MRVVSTDARARFGEASVDLLFVDGSHAYEDVKTDLDQWLSALRPGGTIAFNDPFWPGVNRLLLERACTAGTPLRRPTFADNTVFFTYFPGHDWAAADKRAARTLRRVLRVGGACEPRYQLPVSNARLPYPVKFALVWPATRGLRRLFEALLARYGRA